MEKIFKMLVQEVEKGKVVRVPYNMYNWFLNCVPPKFMEGTAYMNSEMHSFNKNDEPIFWVGFKRDKFYYGCHCTIQQYRDREPLKRLQRNNEPEPVKAEKPKQATVNQLTSRSTRRQLRLDRACRTHARNTKRGNTVRYY
jgi:hypothetical protein